MDEVERILAELLERAESGERIDWNAACGDYPAVRDELRARIARLRQSGLLPESREHAEARSTPEERYELRRELGRGGMGRVWLAFDRLLGREVALKRMEVARGAAESDRAVERFLAEARAMARLEHPGIVSIHDAGRMADGTPYLTMKLVTRGTLKERMASWAAGRPTESGGGDASTDGSDPEPPLRKKLEMVAAAARAVHSAHGKGVLHRDLKPSNLLVGEHGEVLVTDWGLARLDEAARAGPAHGAAEGPSSPELTATGDVVGTPSYMAPEQARREPVDARTDVWGLGSVLHQLVTGAPPYAGRDLSEVLAQARAGVWDERTLERARLPPAVRAICRRALAPEPSQRYARAADLADDLDAYLRGEPGRAWRDPAAARVARVIRRYPLRSTWLVVLLGVALAAWEIRASRVDAEHARTPVRVRETLAALAVERDGRMLGNDSTSIAAWARDYLRSARDSFGALGLPLEGSPVRWKERLADLGAIDPTLERLVLDELYLHAFALFKACAVNVQLMREGRPQPSYPSRQGDPGGWANIDERVPDIVDQWSSVRDLLLQVEPRPEITSLWREAVHFMETGQLQLDSKAPGEEASPSENALRGRLLSESKRIEEARRFLEAAILLDPGRASLHQDWIDAVRRTPPHGRGEGIDPALLRHYQAFAALRPRSAFAKASLGAKLHATGAAGAEAWIGRAIDLDPRVAALIARSLFESDRHYALGLVENASERVPRDVYTWRTVADLNSRMGDMRAELSARRVAVQIAGDGSEMIRLALTLMELGGYPLRPDDLEGRGRWEEAEQWWERVVVERPGFFRGQQELGFTRLVLGEYSSGLQAIEESLEARQHDLSREAQLLHPASHLDRVGVLARPEVASLFVGPGVPEEERERAREILEEVESLIARLNRK